MNYLPTKLREIMHPRQRFWKLSASGKNWGTTYLLRVIDANVKNGKFSVGWYKALGRKDLKCFETKKCDVQNFYRIISKKLRDWAAGKILTLFYFGVKPKDLVFLYGKPSYSIAAIGQVKKGYYFDIKQMKKIYHPGPRFPYFIDVDWFCDMRDDPIDARRVLENCGLNLQPTVVQLDTPGIYNKILKLAKKKNPTVNFSKYIKISKASALPIEKESPNVTKKILAHIRTKDSEVREGKRELREYIWRSRNRSLIERKKSASNYNCEVCGFNFAKKYGTIGREFIIAHHTKPLAEAERVIHTRLSDIVLLCSNCHNMAHKRRPRPYAVKELRRVLKKVA